MQVALILPFMRLGEVILREKHLPLSPVSLKDIIFNHPGKALDIAPFSTLLQYGTATRRCEMMKCMWWLVCTVKGVDAPWQLCCLSVQLQN